MRFLFALLPPFLFYFFQFYPEMPGALVLAVAFHALALDAIRRKLIPVERLVTHTLPLEEVGRAFEIAASGEGLKVVVTA